MKNIYDIIVEQRLYIDAKLASYDLNHTIDYFTDNQDTYYIQEGLGDSIKNATQKVIEFIRAVINKIKELFRKIIDFFSKKRSGKERFTETMNKLSDGKGGGSSSNNTKSNDKEDKVNSSNKEDRANSGSREDRVNSSNKEDRNRLNGNAPDSSNKENNSNSNTKEDKPKSNKKETNSNSNSSGGGQYYKYRTGSKPQSFRMHVQNSLRTVNIVRYASLAVKYKVAETFFNAILSVSGNLLANYDHANDKLFIRNIKKNTFKGDGSFAKLPEASMAERIRAEIKEPTEPENIKVADLDVLMEEYIYIGTDKIDRNLKGWHDNAVKNLTGMEQKLQKLQNADNDKSKDIANVQQIATMVSNFMNFLPMNVLNAYNTLDKIYQQIDADAIAAYGE